jgi:hypothetical protein
MKGRSFILRCAAFFLLLIFSQKAGTGLLLHNLLHTTQTVNDLPGQNDSNKKESNYACNCIDDFLMPFTQADEPVIAAVMEKPAIHAAYQLPVILFISTVHSSLRGPPASIL